MRRHWFIKILPYAVPFFSIIVLAGGLYFILKVFNNHPERLVGDVLLISGAVALIMTFTVSLASTQLFEAVIYIVYRIRKLLNPRLEKYDNPESFFDFHNSISTEGFILTIPSYVMSLLTLTAGLIYLQFFVVITEELTLFLI